MNEELNPYGELSIAFTKEEIMNKKDMFMISQFGRPSELLTREERDAWYHTNGVLVYFLNGLYPES